MEKPRILSLDDVSHAEICYCIISRIDGVEVSHYYHLV
jgi:hypothetical protein